MQHLDTGTYGAKVQSWKQANPRDLLKKLIEGAPGADREALLAAFRARLKQEDGEDYLDAIIEYWFSNNYHSLVQRPERVAKQRQEARAATERAVSKAKTVFKERVREEAIKLLDLPMPNGKELRNCTGADCKTFGGWLGKVAEKVGARKKVGTVLSEAQVRKLYRA